MKARMSLAQSGLWLGRIASFTLILALLSLAGCMGCGDEELQVDPTVDEGFDSGIDDVQIDDDPFGTGGSTTDDAGTEAEDLDAEPLTPVTLEDVFFGFDEFDLDAEARAVLARNARLLRDEDRRTILIEGHCDERGTVQYNLALGEKRANEVMRYLVTLGVDGGRIETVSYGKERPFAVGSGEDVWSQNRRAHFVVRGGTR
jgi:peptidoglycan-associated lipoprotein